MRHAQEFSFGLIVVKIDINKRLYWHARDERRETGTCQLFHIIWLLKLTIGFTTTTHSLHTIDCTQILFMQKNVAQCNLYGSVVFSTVYGTFIYEHECFCVFVCMYNRWYLVENSRIENGKNGGVLDNFPVIALTKALFMIVMLVIRIAMQWFRIRRRMKIWTLLKNVLSFWSR